MAYTIEHIPPTAKQWMSLRESVGWEVFPEEAAEQSLAATLFCACAYEDGELIGMARVLGDGVSCFYIGNVLVHPSRQQNGIGKAIMREIMAYVEKHAVKGATAALFSVKGKEEFYTKFGFSERPNDVRGSGMSKNY